VKKSGGKGLIGVNILSSSKHYEEYVTTAVNAGAQAIISGGGIPTALPGICKGRAVLLIPVVSSARAASVIIRNWTKKYDRVPDAVIFESSMAGGNLGFKEEQLGNAQETFYKSIVEIKNELAGFPGCKLIVAGGIYSRQDAGMVIACGADGIQLGSRFVTTFECDAPIEFKQAYLNLNETGVTTIKGLGSRADRVINNKFAKRIQKGPVPIRSCDGCIVTCDGKEAPFCFKEALITSVSGDTENGLMYCGGNAWKADKIETVKEVFDYFTL